MTISLINKRVDLPLLSIRAAEELQRLKLKKDTSFENTKQLAVLIKEDFANRLDYSQIFKQAYHSTYLESITNINRKIGTITQQLESRLNLKDEELKKLVNFCTNLSDYSALHEEEIRILKEGPCF
jgi:regulator of sigma D